MGSNDPRTPEFCTGAYVRRRFGTSFNALYRAVVAGHVEAVNLPGEAPRYRTTDVERWAAQRASVTPRHGQAAAG